MSATTVLTRETAKIVIHPVDHFAGARFTRRCWRASLAERTQAAGPYPQDCAHSHGHQTVEAAKKCGAAMWDKLPRT